MVRGRRGSGQEREGSQGKTISRTGRDRELRAEAPTALRLPTATLAAALLWTGLLSSCGTAPTGGDSLGIGNGAEASLASPGTEGASDAASASDPTGSTSAAGVTGAAARVVDLASIPRDWHRIAVLSAKVETRGEHRILTVTGRTATPGWSVELRPLPAAGEGILEFELVGKPPEELRGSEETRTVTYTEGLQATPQAGIFINGEGSGIFAD